MIVAVVATALACVPSAELDPCTGCPGACSDALCELAELDGPVRSIAAGKTGVFACTTTDATSELFRVTRAATSKQLATLPGPCVRVVVADPFVYVGVVGGEGGVYRADQTGAGLHLEVPEPGLADFTVQDGVITMAVAQRSTPVTVSPELGVRVVMRQHEQTSEVGTVVAVGDGRLAWSVPSRREVLLTSAAGEGSPVFDAPASGDVGSPFLLSADRDGIVVVDAQRLILLSVDSAAFPEALASGLSEPTALALTPSDAVIADRTGIRTFSRDSTSSIRLSGTTVAHLATADREIFGARGSKIVSVRRP